MSSRQFGAESTAIDERCATCPRDDAEEALRTVNAALEEQARSIGQALHDETGQILAAAHNSLAEAFAVAPSSMRIHLSSIKNDLDVIEHQLRRLAHELRPRILDDFGLVAALRFLTDGANGRDDLAVVLTATLDGPIPAMVETAVYRLVQESLTNIRRHARANRVLVEVEERPGLLWCRLRDDGVGFDATRSPSGLGLVGIRDRLNSLGATFTVDSEPGLGTVLLAMIPLERRNGYPRSAR